MSEYGGCVSVCDSIEASGLFVNKINELKLYNCDSNYHRNILEVNVAHKVAEMLFYQDPGQLAHKNGY